MYICSYALFLKEMLMFRYTVAHMNANIHLVMNSFGTLFHDKIFSPDISLTIPTVNNIPDMFQIPWHFQVFQTSGHPEHCTTSLQNKHEHTNIGDIETIVDN